MKHKRLGRFASMILAACCLLIPLPATDFAPDSGENTFDLLPIPQKCEITGGRFRIDPGFTWASEGFWEPRLARAKDRFLQGLSDVTGMTWTTEPAEDSEQAGLLLHCSGPGEEIQSLQPDESYTLEIGEIQIRLSAATPLGILRGLETVLQLVYPGESGFQLPCVQIEDRPRFVWRGLLIDSCRHWMPLEVIKRNLEGMAAVKLNVLHWHLSDDQGFRVQSRTFPRLHGSGSDGLYYAQDQIREVIAFARDRGIRIVPEFDMPGHTTAWFAGYPELASRPGPYRIERTWGIKDPCMDPTRETTYEFLDRFIGEMAALFPDTYFHIGGDEVNGRDWDGNQDIRAFKRKQGNWDNRDLQAYFNRRVLRLLRKYGKSMVGWDEIFHPALPQDAVVQSWRGQESLASSARAGHMAILSHGYYLDHMLSAEFHYRNDPLSGDAAELSSPEQGRILGGEACMWSEFVSPETIDSRIWPRLAAVAERLWSPAGVGDPEDLYRRLDIIGGKLKHRGLRHRSGPSLMLQRLTGFRPLAELRILADIVEPVKYYTRPNTREYRQQTPLNRFVDAVRPESREARRFRTRIETWACDPTAHSLPEEFIRESLNKWKHNHEVLASQLESNFLLDELMPLSRRVAGLSRVGLEALEVFQDGREASETWLCSILPFLSQPLRPDSEVDIRITPGIRRLVQTAFQQHGGSEYAGLEILHVDTFSDPRPFGWETHPRNSWEIREERGERSLHLLTPGSQGAIRAPTAYALLRNHEVSDFVFSGRIRCLADPDNPHRDMLVVFNFQDPFHFYYIHFSAVSDEVHNIIGLVNGSDRIKINLEPAGGSRAVLTDRMYHHFKVVYAADSGNIRAFLDDMNTPLLTAQDKTLGHGRVGVGSFDDTGSFTSIVLWGTRIQEKE